MKKINEHQDKNPDACVSVPLWCIGLCTITLTMFRCFVNEIKISFFRVI